VPQLPVHCRRKLRFRQSAAPSLVEVPTLTQIQGS